MKRFNFLLVVVVVLVTAVGCTTMTGTQDGYYNGGQPTRANGNRVYVTDPYRGTIVLERDPWSGRYYEVSPYGTYYGNRYYGRGYDTYRRNNVYYGRGNSNYQRQPQQSTEEQRRRNGEQRNEARKKVLGN